MTPFQLLAVVYAGRGVTTNDLMGADRRATGTIFELGLLVAAARK